MAKRVLQVNKNTNKKVAVFYNAAIDNSMLEAESIKKLFSNNHVDTVSDPTIEKVKEISKDKTIIHLVTHQENNHIIFNDHIIESSKFVESLPDNLDLVVLNICKGGRVTQTGDYPIIHKSLAHKLLAKNAKHVITNTWDLGQDASLEFTRALYNDYLQTQRFNKFPYQSKNRLPSEYGGYMYWGH